MHRCNLCITRRSETAAWLCRSENGDEKNEIIFNDNNNNNNIFMGEGGRFDLQAWGLSVG